MTRLYQKDHKAYKNLKGKIRCQICNENIATFLNFYPQCVIHYLCNNCFLKEEKNEKDFFKNGKWHYCLFNHTKHLGVYSIEGISYEDIDDFINIVRKEIDYIFLPSKLPKTKKQIQEEKLKKERRNSKLQEKAIELLKYHPTTPNKIEHLYALLKEENHRIFCLNYDIESSMCVVDGKQKDKKICSHSYALFNGEHINKNICKCDMFAVDIYERKPVIEK